MASDNSDKNSTLIQRIEIARKKRGFRNPSEVMDKADVSRPSLSGWKKGTEPSRKNIEAVARALQVSPEWLLGISDSEPNWDSSPPPRHQALKEGTSEYEVHMLKAVKTDTLEALATNALEQHDWAAVQLFAEELRRREGITYTPRGASAMDESVADPAPGETARHEEHRLS